MGTNHSNLPTYWSQEVHVMILCTFEQHFTQFYLALAIWPAGARLAGQAVISDSKRSAMLDPDGAYVAFAV